MSPRGLDEHPAWLREIDSSLTVTPAYVLHGNLRDRYLVPIADGRWAPLDLHPALWDTLRRSGYAAVIRHTPGGVQVYPNEPAALRAVAQATGLSGDFRSRPIGPDQLTGLLRAVTSCRDTRLALTIDYVSQWRPAGTPPSDAEHAFMQSALAVIHDAVPTVVGHERTTGLFNPVLWLVDRPADLPPWLTGGSEGIRQISVPQPELGVRLRLARSLIGSMQGGDQLTRPALEDAADRFAERSVGMSLRAMIATTQLALDQNLGPERIDDAVRAYQIGMTDNPWADTELRNRLRKGEAVLTAKVKGQRRAVRHALDILIRSNTGMSGAERGGDATGPRGILFFAGPTGVGKTELAKRITHLVFGDQNAYVRFDMSEFAADHSEARLIGSPPGYEGHGEGGELTNAVRQRPFCVVLFDEVEKAHPRILDKFLQILSDGRLTDGSGDTVHFGETIIVFTSNLGVPELRPGEPVPVGAELEAVVKHAIEHEFSVTIHRPELLGRIGDNIVVFDYIDPVTAVELADNAVGNVMRRAAEQHGVELTLAPEVRRDIVELAVADLSKGGRGIERVVESTLLVNPLARALFDLPAGTTTATVNALVREEGGWFTTKLV
ncbi:AAA family ATPase [Kribbella sp. NPDC026611]|uniref:AAA family ATPase n=1 Tax=Kribbella sp. NPDC026611 TaxID=3154911 RepID=UPI0033DAFE01